MPAYRTNSDVTANLAMKRAELEKKCQIIEKTAEQADSYLAKEDLMDGTKGGAGGGAGGGTGGKDDPEDDSDGAKYAQLYNGQYEV